jgi:ubiquinol-cytochrome c reductase cytochrome b subunit
VSFHPYYTVKDAFYLSLFVIVFAVLVFYAPDFVGNPDNYTPANPLVTPPHIVPEWYLLPFYAMLRSIPQKLIGVIVLFGALATLAFAPWLDTSKVRSMRFRPMMKPFFWILVLDCILLGYLGANRPDATWNLAGIEISLVWPARFGTLYYYAYFWLLLPLIGLIETPKPLPDSIAKPVLAAAE